MDAGACGVTLPCTLLRTASALRASGTLATTQRLFMICRIDIEMACLGTASSVGNQPSPNCCCRHAASRSTMIRRFRLEIRRRVVEGEVTVFTDADEGHIDRRAVNERAEPAALRLRITLAVDIVKCGQRQRQL